MLQVSDVDAHRLHAIERALVSHAPELALHLIYDRPSRVLERPGLARTFYAERCVSEPQLERMIDAFRTVGAYVELFEGEQPFLAALTQGRLDRIGRRLQVAYNGIGFGIGPDAFEPGRKALIPAVADSYGMVCVNSDAYTSALALHKFHSFLLLRSLGADVPPIWHYRGERGWLGGAPPVGLRVIAKSTYEAWSVGVTEESIFVVDESCDDRVAKIAEAIGQPVTVQQFIPGTEVHVSVLACPERIVAPPVEVVLEKAPDDEDAVMTIHDNLGDETVDFCLLGADEELLDGLRSTAVDVFDILQIRGFGRIDFRVDASGRPWLIDAAISPGLDPGEAAPTALAALGFDHPSFMRLVVAATLGSRGLLGN